VAKVASELGASVAPTDAPMVFLNIGEPDFTAPPLVQEAGVWGISRGPHPNPPRGRGPEGFPPAPRR